MNARSSLDALPLAQSTVSQHLKVLKEEIPMFAGDGRMPPDAAETEWRVLSEFNPKFKPVKVEQTYTNRFVDEALRSVNAK